MWTFTIQDPSGKQEQVSYTANGLCQELIGHMVRKPTTYDQDLLVREYCCSLAKQDLLSIPMSTIIESAFRLGFLYRVSLERNNVSCPTDPSASRADTQGTGDQHD